MNSKLISFFALILSVQVYSQTIINKPINDATTTLNKNNLDHILPKVLIGNWFRSNNAEWMISLFDTVAIYKSQVWEYRKYEEKEGLAKLSLKKGSKDLDLYIRFIDDSTCQIGETSAKLIKCDHQPNEAMIPADSDPYKLPVFKIDTVTYCGYIKGFNPILQQEGGFIYVNDLLYQKQDKYSLKIRDDGSFNVKFLCPNPTGIYLRFPNYREIVYVEPGKTTFQLIDLNNTPHQNLFMGDGARFNTDMIKLENINGLDNYKSQLEEEILDFSPEQYKLYCLDLKQKDLKELANYSKTHSLSEKALQVKRLVIDYRYSNALFKYTELMESAYRKKNNIPQDQYYIPFKPTEPDTIYYSFLVNDLVNNPLAVMIPDYFSFILNIKSLNIIQGKPKGYWTSDYMEAWEKKGNNLNSQEMELYNQLKEIDTREIKNIEDEYHLKYWERDRAFFSKHNKELKVLYENKKDTIITPTMEIGYLLDQNVEFTTDEKELIKSMKKYYDSPLINRKNQFYEKYYEQLNQFENDHYEILYEVFHENNEAERYRNLKKLIGIQPGLAIDIMISQGFCQSYIQNMLPVSKDKIKSYQKDITSSLIANYIDSKNNETISKIEANKKQNGSKFNEVPKTKDNKIFDAIIGKYKGKVVFVDFWATWCSPCLAGIEKIKPLKDEMANENVVFVNITNQSSPMKTYYNMVPSIKGEHYRVSDSQWEILHDMFKMKGIPHYVMVGKDGKVINPNLEHLENSELKALLTRYINE